ncbi:MAG: serine hydrolase, partial [Actinomycetia bacterium]|nr:serine hydrolase [Actinomycetes bacterium]
IIIVFVLYLNLVLDQNTFIKMAGVEAGDVEVYVTRHSDADGLSAQIEEFAGVRKTTMLDWISVEVDGNEAMGNISNDFAQMENMATHTGTLPTNDREVALPKLFADQLGKSIGDTVSVRAAGVSQDYTITGFFSVMSNGGRVLAITLDGYQRLDPNYRRASINVYLDDETTFDDFSQALTSRFGVLNVYDQSDGGSFAQAKMVAEEKISNYIEQYDIDSVAYAVISHGDIVAHGSSSQYQIESIVDAREITKSQLGAFAGTVSLVTQLIVVLALLILSLILTMTVKSIITKRYKELGTLKALGFTTAQLVRQQIISLLPTAVIGVAIGCFIGSLVASPLLTTLLASTGAYGTLFSVPPILAVSVGAVMLVASLGVAFLSARRIKNISAYELISQRPVAKKKQRAHPKGIAQKRTLALRSLAMLMVCVFCFTIVSDALYAQEASSATDSGAPQMIEEDLYGIGSISKVYTAAAVMKLVEEGHIDLDEPLTTYLPQFEMADERYTQITPRMLLNHSSGLKGMTDNNAFLLGDNDTYLHDHFLDLLKTQMLKHAPGERSIYCNDGLTLAEILIEAVSGVSYSQYLEATFLAPLGLKQTKTSQGEFDRDLLANTYRGNNELLAETIGVIGTGGIYATPSDLCRFATIFMESADGSVLSKGSTDEMARDQHQDPMVPQDADTIFRYGLGWDAIETYPFTHYGIKALSKGGDTERYHSNLIVLPDYDLAVAVLSSGKDSHGQLIAQEILLAALREEGVIVDETPPSLPESNLDRARIPDEIKAYAGVYDAGFMGILEVEFTEDSLLLTPLMVKNERTVEYLYNTEGEFVSTKGDFIGLSAPKDGAKGITKLSFADQKYLIVNSAIAMPGLSTTAIAVPLAEKLETNTVASDDFEAWKERNEKEYLLVSEKYTSLYYATEPLAKTLVDDRVVGYVGQGIYRGSGKLIKSAKIVDASYASAFQSIPTMLGRDTNDLRITEQQGVEYLAVNEFKYIDASSLRRLSEFNDQLTLGLETLWVDIDEGLGGSELGIVAPQNGSWFVFDDRMNCIATSLEKNPRHSIVLPDRGRIAFAGEEGATFLLGNQ